MTIAAPTRNSRSDRARPPRDNGVDAVVAGARSVSIFFVYNIKILYANGMNASVAGGAAALKSAPTHGKSRVRERLIVALRELIVGGELQGGQKLNELELSLRLKTSRTPLREAMLHLEREGLVRSDLRRGFSVEPLSPREVRETYPVLCALECHAVRSSAEFIPPLLPEL